MKTRYQKGFTVIELIIASIGVATVVGLGIGIWVVTHFLMKVW